MTDSQTLPEGRTELNLDAILRKLLREDIRRRGLSYEEVARELTKRVGQGVSSAMVANWCADSKEAWHIPAYVIPALCEYLGTDAIQRALLNPSQLENLELGESLRRVSTILEKKAAQSKELARLRRREHSKKR